MIHKVPKPGPLGKKLHLNKNNYKYDNDNILPC